MPFGHARLASRDVQLIGIASSQPSHPSLLYERNLAAKLNFFIDLQGVWISRHPILNIQGSAPSRYQPNCPTWNADEKKNQMTMRKDGPPDMYFTHKQGSALAACNRAVGAFMASNRTALTQFVNGHGNRLIGAAPEYSTKAMTYTGYGAVGGSRSSVRVSVFGCSEHACR